MRKILSIFLIATISLGIFIAAGMSEDESSINSIELNFSTDQAIDFSEEFIDVFYQYTGSLGYDDNSIEEQIIIEMVREDILESIQALSQDIFDAGLKVPSSRSVNIKTIDIIKDRYILLGEIYEAFESDQSEVIETTYVVIELMDLEGILLVSEFEITDNKK